MFLEFLAAENLKKHDSRPALSLSRDGVWPIPSGNRVFGVYSCRKPQKHDSRPALSRVPPIPSENRVFSCRKPQKHDSRPALSQDGASGPTRSVAGWGIGSRQFRAKIVFLEFFSCRKTSKFPPRSVAGWGIGSRQFRAGIVFLEFLAAENLKKHDSRPALSRDGASGPARIVFWSF